MFELHIQDPNAQTGMVAVSWCAPPALLKQLDELEIDKPMVLLVVARQESRYAQGKEVRKLVPLTAGMTYIDFRGSGNNRVFAMVVWRKDESKLKNLLSGRKEGEWETDVLTDDGTAFRDWCDKESDDKSQWGLTLLDEVPKDDEVEGWRAVTAHLDVSVPTGLFAKPPPGWEETWVNHWHRNAPVDECEYRKRRL